MEGKYACKDCVHYGVCADSGSYVDATRCPNFVCYAESHENIEKANAEAECWRRIADERERELVKLRAIKKTVEVIFGQGIDI